MTILSPLVLSLWLTMPPAPQQPILIQSKSHSHFFGGFGGSSELVLGSEDPRKGGGLEYGYGAIDKRLTFRHQQGQFVRDLYIEWTHSKGVNGDPVNNAYAIGGIAIARYELGDIYVDGGLGLQCQSIRSSDLPSKINSTPVFGIGVVLPDRDEQYLLGVRILHISNAGTHSKNPGQNQILMTLAIRY